MKVDAFDFDLPPEAIAQRPVRPRDAARLLRVPASGGFEDRGVRDLVELLAPGDLLVVNDTKVIPARLAGQRRGAKVEVTLHKAEGDGQWWAFARPARKLKVGDEIAFAGGLTAQVTDKGEMGEVRLAFGCGGEDLLAALETAGVMPLPPYIRQGRGDERDLDDYQTRFAEKKGAVAAPTAGLHFTDDLLSALAAKGVERLHLTLHVGAGTFLPVKVDDTRDHKMHAEWGEVTAAAADRVNDTRARGGKIVAVGTTALRLLESAAREDGTLMPFCGETDIFITPGYRFRIVDRLMTNFHLPRSTLFMLVSAFAGLDRMQAAYAHAIGQGYRFYSYGDACLLERADQP